MHEPRLIAAFFDDFLDAFFFTERFDFADKLDFKVILCSEALGIFPDLLVQGLRELGIIEYPDFIGVKVRGHPGGETPAGYSALDDDAVVT